MDILYVHSAKQEADARYDKYKSCAPYPFIPVGVVGLVNLLRSQGWQVAGLNLPMELTMQPDFSFRGWLAGQPQPPRLVMIDLHWYEHCFGALDVAATVKSVWPQTFIVIGGLTTSYFAEEILDNFPAVDFAIRGDAEEPLRLLAKYCCGDGSADLAAIPNLIYRENGKARQNLRAYFAGPQDLDRLDFVTTDWLRHPRSYASIQYSGAGIIALHQPHLQGHWLTVGRGCVFNCIYCGGGKHSHDELAGRNGYVVRSPAGVVADIERLKALGYHQVALSLDIATFGPEWWQTFFKLLRERSIRIGIYNEFFQLPPKEFIEELGTTADLSHTEVAISPLSGDETVRRQNGKFYTNERFLRMLETLKRYEVPIFVYFSLNLPGETFQTFKSTLQLAHEVGKVYPHHLLRMLNPCHTLDPVSPMSRQPEAFGMTVHYRTFMDYYNYCKGTGWQPRHVVRGQHRGFEMNGRPAPVVEQMAQVWDMFARQQPFRCFPVSSGW
ncbi:MAG: radical SAM protein [Chloroflexi bacterium]|nr:radical SAM protein [Chloroflexota bacterium]